MPAAETNKRLVKTKVVSPWKNDVAIVDVFTPFIDIRERSYRVLDLGCLLLRSIWCCCTLLMESDLHMVNPSAVIVVTASSTTRRRVWRWWYIMFCWSVVPDCAILDGMGTTLLTEVSTPINSSHQHIILLLWFATMRIKKHQKDLESSHVRATDARTTTHNHKPQAKILQVVVQGCSGCSEDRTTVTIATNHVRRYWLFEMGQSWWQRLWWGKLWRTCVVSTRIYRRKS